MCSIARLDPASTPPAPSPAGVVLCVPLLRLGICVFNGSHTLNCGYKPTVFFCDSPQPLLLSSSSSGCWWTPLPAPALFAPHIACLVRNRQCVRRA